MGFVVVSIKKDPSKPPFLSTYSWHNPLENNDDLVCVEPILNQLKVDAIITTPLVLIAFILAERYRIPVINIGYFCYLFPIKNFKNQINDWFLREMNQFYNNLRNQIGLNSIDNNQTPLIGDLQLIRNIDYLENSESFPSSVICVGGLNYSFNQINSKLELFIKEQKNKRIIYIQIGRLFQNNKIWESIKLLFDSTDMSFIVDSGRSDYLSIKDTFYNNVYIHSFIPLDNIKSSIDCVICSGQTSIILSVIYNNIPFISIPFSEEAKLNTSLIHKKNIGSCIDASQEIQVNYLHSEINKAIDGIHYNDRTSYQGLLKSYDSDNYIYNAIKDV